MTFRGLTLLIPEKPDTERDAVAEAWTGAGGAVVRVGRFWEAPQVDPRGARLYGFDTFCLVLAEKLNLELLSPSEDLLLRVDREWTGRVISLHHLCDANAIRFPVFVKPLTPKQFRAGVYANQDELNRECRGLPPDTKLLTSGLLEIAAEARAFILRSEVRAISIYEGAGDVKRALGFVSSFCQANSLPATCTVDVALAAHSKWCFLEANASWGSGLNGCDAACILGCIEAACKWRGTNA